MESQAAKVLPWNGKASGKERAAAEAAEPTPAREGDRRRGSSGIGAMPASPILILSDEQIEALGALYCMNPVRHHMTFEAYLVVKGCARD